MSRRADARLAALATDYDLDNPARAALASLLDTLAADPEAPSAVREPAKAVDVHLADSLTALRLPEVDRALDVADLGAGAGFPGLVLAAARPAMRVTLVESSRRKCAFLTRASAAAGLESVAIACTRVEQWEEGLGACDLVTARAVAELAVLLEYAAPLLREGGALVAWKGRRDEEEEARGRRAAAALGLAPARVEPVTPYPGAQHHHLHVFLKVSPTPAGYPRRPGMAVKRPRV